MAAAGPPSRGLAAEGGHDAAHRSGFPLRPAGSARAREPPMEARGSRIMGRDRRPVPARPEPASPGGAPTPARTVEAERFVLRDARGRIGASLGWEADGTPRLALHDPSAQVRAALGVG